MPWRRCRCTRWRATPGGRGPGPAKTACPRTGPWSRPTWGGRPIAEASDARASPRRQAAEVAGARFIDATIRIENTGGQAFYEGVAFTDYRVGAETVSKRFAPG